MNLYDCTAAAVTAIATNSLRSLLTILGIVIGVGSVIVMTSIGLGAHSEIDRQIRSLGTNVLVASPAAKLVGGRSSAAGLNLPLSEDELRAIEMSVPGIVAISGQLWAGVPVVHGNANFWTRICAVHAPYLATRGWSID